MKARLVGRRRDGTTKSFPLGGQARIGSAPVSEVVVERERVSPLHALITFEDDAYWVEDKQSAYGTFVNGNRVGKTKLRNFDVLTIAPDVSLIFLTSQPGTARVETNAEPAGHADTLAVARARAPVALPQFARTMNEPMPEDLRNLAAEPKGGLPPGVLKAAADAARDAATKVPPASPPPVREPETMSVARRPEADALIDTVRLVGDTGTFKTTLGTCIVGRGTEAAVRINSKEISRRHAQIVVRPTEITVEDLNSANGTKVNGVAVTVPANVRDGDTVSFAGFKFRVEIARIAREG
jgi:pSer/pThr/pTyr-binding forkhead associated (FHA) protein